MLAAQKLQDLCESLCKLGRINADNLPARAGWVQQGSQQIENGSHTQLLTHSSHDFYRLMKGWGKQEGNPTALQTSYQNLFGCIDPHAQLAQHIGAAAAP